jgi:hypothetical protein
MERQHLFNLYYGSELLGSIVAHTKWEAVDRIYHRMVDKSSGLERAKIRAKKIY